MIIETNRQENIKLIICYLKYKNSFNFGFQDYKFWKLHLMYITGINNQFEIRSFFYSLLYKNIFTKKKIFNKICYLFNPTKKNYQILSRKKFVLTFD